MGKVQNFRYNIMHISSITDFKNVKGGFHNQYKDVYFVRAVGTSPDYQQEIQRMDEDLCRQMQEGRGFYRRISSLPKLQAVEDVTFYSECYDIWLASKKSRAEIRSVKKNQALSGVLAEACAVIEEMYRRHCGQVTASILKNFMIKMLFWYDAVFADEEFQWDLKTSMKIAVSNIEKKQEYFFFYLVSLTGCDVLLLQSAGDIAPQEEKLGLSEKFILGGYSKESLPPYRRSELYQKDGQTPKGQSSHGRTTLSEEAFRCPERERVHRAAGVQNGNNRSAGSERNAVEKRFEELAQCASSVVLIAVHDARGEIVGTGSGIMIGADGYILTNHHVIAGGRVYSVRIENDEQVYMTDEIVKYNSVLDLGIIRIDRILRPLPLYRGNKKLLRGQKVVAIGSPLGLFNSVSDGIISGFRNIQEVEMIQFTAPVSHGSSGGALLNMQGQVIGISTAGIDSGQNINLAVGYESVYPFAKSFLSE